MEHTQFTVNEENFDRWYVRLESKIMEDTGIMQFEAMGFIDELFDATLKKFGYKGYHPLYRSARLMLAKIGEILVDAVAITRNNLQDIDELIDRKGSCKQFYRYLKNNPNSYPRTSPAIKLRDDIITAAINKPNAKFTNIHATQIENTVRKYLDAVQDFRKGRDIFNNWKNKPSYRKKLLTNIIDKCVLLQKVGSLTDISKLLFGGSTDYISITFLALQKDKYMSRPNLETIFKILFNVNKWSVKTFSNLEIATTYQELIEFKRIIYNEVKAWVYNVQMKEKNWVRYLTKTKKPFKQGATTSTELDYDLVFSIWQAAILHENNPSLTFEDMKDLKLFKRGRATWIKNLRKGIGFKPQTIRNILNTAKQWAQEQSDLNPHSYKLKYYFSLQARVAWYASGAANKMSLTKPHTSTRIFNGRRFGEHYIMAYHIITGFGKHLGMDPLVFSSIKDEAYHLTKDRRITLKRLGEKLISFIRHHFRDDPVGRDSFFTSDLVTTDNSKHMLWESLTEAESLIVLRGFEQLVRIKGSGLKMSGTSGINEVTRADIERVFKGNEWVYGRWYSNREFSSNLREFNEKREAIRELRLDEFIKTYNPIAYNRFYVNILKDKRPQLQLFLSELHPALDLSKVYKAAAGSPYLTQITRAFSELLRQYNHPIKI